MTLINGIILALSLYICVLVVSAIPPIFSDGFNDGDYNGWIVTDVANSQNQNSYMRNFWLSKDYSQWEVQTDNKLKMHWRTVGKGYHLTNRGSWLWWGTESQLRSQYYWNSYSGSVRTSVPLGIGANTILDGQITCTGQEVLRDPWLGRLDNRDSSWTGQIGGGQNLDINLGKAAYITALAVQGAPDLPQWVDSFKFWYKAPGGSTWISNGIKTGSTDQNSTVFITISPDLYIQQARFEVLSYNGAPSMRVELYGRYEVSPLGMGVEQVLAIPAAQIKNSSFSSDSYDGRYARLGSSSHWTAATTVVANEYLQIDLGQQHTISAVAVQTAYGVLKGVTSYTLKYGNDGTTWTSYNSGAVQTGPSTAADEVVTVTLSPTILARYIRFIPVTFITSISMRCEIYGEPLTSEALTLGPFAWTDYTVSANLEPFGRGQLGVAFRYLNQYNYYEYRYFHGQSGNLVDATTGLNMPIKVQLKTGMTYTGTTNCNTKWGNSIGYCLFDDSTNGALTASFPSPYIKIDLRGIFTIEHITIENKYYGFVNSFYVYLQDTTSTSEAWKYCGAGVVSFNAYQTLDFDCYNVSGRYIYLASTVTTPMAIGEVDIYGPTIVSHRDLMKVENGVSTILSSDSYEYVPETTIAVDINVVDNVITVYEDGGTVFTYTDTDTNTPLIRGTVAATISQEVGSKFDDFQVVFDTTILSINSAVSKTVKTGTWKHFSVDVTASTNLVLGFHASTSTGCCFHIYERLDASVDYNIYDTKNQENTLDHTSIFIANPVIGTYYFGVFSSARDTYSNDISVIAQIPSVASIQEGHDGNYTLGSKIDWHFYEVTVRTSYSILTTTFSAVTAFGSNPIKILYRKNTPPTQDVYDASITVSAGNVYTHILSFPIPTDKYYYAVVINDDLLTTFDYNILIEAPHPSILSIDPTSAGTAGGQIISISGDNFGTNGTVTIGSFTAKWISWSTSLAVVTAPKGEGKNLNIFITTDLLFLESNKLLFSYNAPAVTGLNPNIGPTAGGTSVIVSGSNFGLNPVVTLNDIVCVITAKSVLHNQLTFLTPNSTGASQIVKVTVGSQVSGNKFFSYNPPSVSSLNPNTGSRTIGDELLIINGLNFGTRSPGFDSVIVEIGGNILTIVSKTDTQLVVRTPAGQGTDKTVRVEVNGQSTTAAIKFSYIKPIVNDFNPKLGPTMGGQRVTIVGDNFGITPGVTIGGRTCTIDVAVSNHTYIVCVSPEGEGKKQSLLVTVGQLSSTIVYYDYRWPTIDNVSPLLIDTRGIDHVWVVGRHFGLNPTVYLGILPCEIDPAFHNHTHIKCLTPVGDGGTAIISMRVALQDANNTYTIGYHPPNIITVGTQRLSTKGQATISLSGTNFGPTTALVYIGNELCPTIAGGHGHTKVQCTLPEGMGENLRVSMLVNGQWSNDMTYSYAAPSISSFSPTTFETIGGATQLLTLTGSSFGTSGDVWVNETYPCVPTTGGWAHGTVVCEVPELTVGDGIHYSLRMNVSAQVSNIRHFDYLSPHIDSISPIKYASVGSSTTLKILYIYGYSFSNVGSVMVGNNPCLVDGTTYPGTLYGHSEIRCALPAGHSSSVPVVVTTSYGRVSNIAIFSYDPPVISTRSPSTISTKGTTNTSPAGEYLTLTGTSFYTQGEVLVDGKNCTQKGAFAQWTHTKIVCWVPSGVGTSNVIQVFVGDQFSNTLFIDYDPPSIDANGTSIYGMVSPYHSSTRGGVTITIYGQNFGTTAGKVSIGGSYCTITSQNHTKIIAVTPSGLLEGNKQIQVQVSNAFSNIFTFVIDGPQLYSINPSHGATNGNEMIILRGDSFDTNPRVTFNGVLATLGNHNSTYIEVYTPVGSGNNVEVIVGTEFQTSFSKAKKFAYDPPTITGIAPLPGPTGGTVSVLLTGTNLGKSNTIMFGTQSCPTRGAGATHDNSECTLPAGYGHNVAVVVTVNGQVSSPFFYNYSDPIISLITGPSNANPPPAPTDGGTILTITGTDFSSSGSVTVGGVACPIYSFVYGHLLIKCSLPPGQGTNIPVLVQYGVQTSNTYYIDYDPPSITSITPTSGPTKAGATVLTIVGKNFGSSASVTVGGSDCSITGIGVTNTRIECLVPEGEGISHLVQVNSSNQLTTSSLLASNTWSYSAPVLTSIDPIEGRTAGGYNLTLTGSSFGLNPTVEIANSGDTACNVTYNNHDKIICTVPSGLGVSLNTKVTVASLSSGTKKFSYLGPVITSVTSPDCKSLPATGEVINCPVDATTYPVVITINGDNFGPATAGTVTIGGLSCVTTAGHNTATLETTHTQYFCGLDDNVGLQLPIYMLVGSLTTTANLVSYSGPNITATYLQSQGVGSISGHVNLTTTLGGEVVGIQGTFFGSDYTLLEVKYGPVGAAWSDPELFTCTVSSTDFSDTFLWCTTSESIGGDLVWYLHKTVSGFEQYSDGSADTISTPIPQFVPLTIRKGLQYKNVLTADDGHVRGTNTQGEEIVFNATDIGSAALQNSLGSLRIYYGNPNDYTEECTNVVIAVDGLTFTCRTSPQFEEVDHKYHFIIRAAGLRSRPSEDYYQFPIAPEVTQVRGCSDVGSSTFDCPTVGGKIITIYGSNFTSAAGTLFARVGVSDCTNPIYVSETEMTCILPKGVGLEMPVTVVTGTLFSSPKKLLNYAAPTITSVSGCPVAGTTLTSTTECPRAGGRRITLDGTNFGPVLPLILIGGEECGNASTIVTDHTQVFCDIPQGTDQNKAVLLVQTGGELSTNRGSLSYVQCAAGSYAISGDVNCTLCGLGSYTDVDGQQQCKECESGYYSDTEGLTSCLPCSSGFYSVRVGGLGPQSCTVCDAGKFNDANAQASCKDCPAGTYINATDINGARTTCHKCDAGKYNSGTGQIECTNCTSGTFSSTDGAVSCQDCPSGQYQPYDGGIGCKICPTGRANPNPASATCGLCQLGQYQNAPGQANCLECDAGYFSNDTELDTCFKCKSGSFSVKISGLFGAQDCTPCSAGQYVNADAQATCLQCGKGTYSPSDGAQSCTPCEAGRHASLLSSTFCPVCLAGTYAGTSGFVDCKDCGAGTYAPATEATECKPCEVGKASSATAATNCAVCLAGSAMGFTGQVACVQCESGTFANDTSFTACQECPIGTYSAKVGPTGPIECIECSPGYYVSSAGQDVCDACPVGTYGDGYRLSECTDCPVGKANAIAGSSSCTGCDPGYYTSVLGAIVCDICPAGTYSSGIGNSSCTECDPGYYQPNPGQSSCIPCVAGEYTDTARQGTYKLCPVGTYNDIGSATECTDCIAGKYQNVAGSVDCINCSPGSYLEAVGQVVCLSCPVGTFQKHYGNTSCEDCPPGYISTLAGSTDCTICPGGKYSTGGTSFCVECPPGTYQDTAGSGECIPCESGFIQPLPAQQSCDACLPGTFIAATGSLSCKSCPVGRYAAEYNSTECILCPAGKYEGVGGASECTNCTAGTYSGSDGSASCLGCLVGSYTPRDGLSKCLDCDMGYYQDQASQSSCIPCAAGDSVSVGGQGACTECSEGTYTNSLGSVECLVCDPGKFSVKPNLSEGPQSCQSCPKGKYQNAYGQNGCLDCPVGYYLNETDGTDCIPCAAGYATVTSGSELCTPCALGRYAPNVGTITCSLCPVGTKSSTGSSTGATGCISCDPGEYQDISGKTTCISCVEGYYNGAYGQGVCTACEIGKYSDVKGSTECQKCLAGYYQSLSGQSICEPCLPGEYTSVDGEAKCSQCDAGTYASGSNSSACIDCEIGTYSIKIQPGDLGPTSCTSCGLGKYINTVGQASCLKCEVGRYAPTTNLVECNLCEVGKFTDQAGLSVCEGCPPGSYTDIEGTITCVTCPVGTYQPDLGQQECLNCPNGTYQGSTGQQVCIDCPIGEYNSVDRQAVCKKCPAGEYTDNVGFDECIQCSPGKYQTKTGQSECIPCPLGEYTDEYGAVSCKPCKEGTFANETGLFACFDCDPGTSQPSKGQSNCTLCEPGTYQTARAQRTCIACAAGKFANVSGLIDCYKCAPGTAQASSGQASCIGCDPGYAQPQPQQKTCIQCDKGTFMPYENATNCLPCSEGMFQQATGSLICDYCTPGTYSEAQQASTCKDCAIGTSSNDTGLNTTCPVCDLGSYQTSAGQTSCTKCAAGSFSVNPLLGACELCAAGKYQDQTGQQGCIECDRGTYQISEGKSECIFCPNGTEGTDTGMKSCRPCSAGYYQNETNSLSCKPCKAGSYQPNRGYDVCIPCEPGKATPNEAQQSCTACLGGYFNNVTGSIECSPCTVGKYQGSSGQLSCIECEVGKAQNLGNQKSCVSCTAGKFSNDTALESCIECATGKYQGSDGKSYCDDCPVGQISFATGLKKCYLCGVGEYNAKNASEVCEECLPGEYQSNQGQSQCNLCSTGKYNADSRKSFCSDCVAGRFANVTGMLDCIDCPSGKYQSSDGKSFCIDCSVGSFALDTGSKLCSACQVGRFINETGAKECSKCQQGYYQNLPNKQECLPCGQGKYCDTEECETCTFCPAGTYSGGFATITCDICPMGSTQTVPGSIGCDDCTPGFYADQQPSPECFSCDVGKFSNISRATTCYDCHTGTATASIASANCSYCSKGYYTDRRGDETCFSCSSGKYSDVLGAVGCKECPMGKYQPQNGQGSCVECPTGTYSSAVGQSVCLDCAAGKFNNNTGQTECVSCRKGYYQQLKQQDKCDKCPVGRFSNSIGKDVCELCGQGSAQPLEGQQSCVNCEAGRHQSQTGQADCVDCEIGRFVASTGQADCTFCSPGYYANVTRLESCIPCRSGQYQSENGKSKCKDCIAGTSTANTGAKICPACQPGTYTPVNGTQGCLQCQSGKYQSLSSQTTCLLCSKGHFSTSDGADTCEPCAQGKYASAKGMSECVECDIGSYQNDIGKIECNLCAAGTFSIATGRKECTTCSTAEYANITGMTFCWDCPVGTYNDLQGMSYCQDCPAGEYTNQPHSRVCALCDVGTFTKVVGSQECDLCEKGTQQPQTGKSTCDLCAKGRYAENKRTDVCIQCPAGKFSTSLGSHNCTSCPIGRYQDEIGTTTCIDCAKGRYSGIVGQKTCQACALGEFGNSTGAHQCHKCPAGTFGPLEGAMTCSYCAAGRYSAIAQKECANCAAGTVTDHEGSTGCVACSTISVASFNKTECLCKSGYYLPYYDEGSNVFECDYCPIGADCDATGSRWDSLKAQKGWWRSTNESETFYRCLLRAHCEGGTAASSIFSETSGSGCAPHRLGIMCSYCEQGFREGIGAACDICPRNNFNQWLTILSIGFGFVLLIWIQMYVILRSGEDQLKSVQTVAEKRNFLNADFDNDDVDDSYLSFSDSSSSSSSSSGSSSSSDSNSSDKDDVSVSKNGSGSDVDDDNENADMVGFDDKNTEEVDFDGDSMSVLQKYGPPPPKPNFTYKLKIFVGFLQLITNISSDLEIQWPTTFTSFIILFDVANFDYLLVQVTSSDCIANVGYYQKYLATVLGPIVVAVLVLLLYVIPKQFDCCCYKFATANARMRSRIRFWRVVLYALFIIYPGVSSTVLAHYVCMDVDNSSYLKADFRVECDTDQWLRYAFGSMVLVLLYPVGIPLSFLILLRMHRHQLRVPKVKHSLGFLYAGYRDELWWFELVDTFHKLFITSFLAFLDQSIQLNVGMLIVTAYTIVILRTNPYLRTSDDKLHLLANTEIILCLLAGNVFYHLPVGGLSHFDDVVMSITLMFMCLGFFVVFLVMAGTVLRKEIKIMWGEYQKAKIVSQQEKELAEEEKRLAEEEGKDKDGSSNDSSDSDSSSDDEKDSHSFSQSASSRRSVSSKSKSSASVSKSANDSDDAKSKSFNSEATEASSSEEEERKSSVSTPKQKNKVIMDDSDNSDNDSSSNDSDDSDDDSKSFEAVIPSKRGRTLPSI